MTHGILNWRTCKKCGAKFDRGINYDLCPKCRMYAHLEVNPLKKEKQTRLKI